MQKRPELVALGLKIRELRIQKGWSQEVFAQKCGLHRTYIGMIERGERNPNYLTLKKILVALNKQFF